MPQETHLLLVAQLRGQQQSWLHKLRKLSVVEKWRRLLDVQLHLSGKVVRLAVQQVNLLQRPLELGVFAKALQLGVQGRYRRFVTLKRAESNKNHAVFKMRDLDAAGVMLELDLVPDTAHVVISQSSMQVYKVSKIQ